MSNKRKELPVGFFDDPLADAKARKLNIKEEVAKAQEKEWEDFQSFVATVETEDRDEETTKADEAAEEDGLEKLEQMEYMERLRKTLLRVSKKESGADDDKDANDDNAEDEASVITDATDPPVDIMSEVLKARSKAKAKAVPVDDDDEDLDLLDWRAKRH
ncbi:hypothetical protein SDRG_06015 [Saprolegnia diclina VS20]|uniref:ZNF380 coiled-coil domain-containing protein n=1 Tax=Saprolegnia diclina (strain VS20) TaxID=1156394 RepID=T0QF70_SAPDV|nr:hypothetical protein SDRG_06015 [Saprolegnia diclina VS20]EQC36569.1 hypothetical protein SDRG_06015 [Saprolegnia diclina VS20]|eukprot:XP_008609990.1 hypothetical protein SDRG_06015 [Saprolegnia diclina VS20]